MSVSFTEEKAIFVPSISKQNSNDMSAIKTAAGFVAKVKTELESAVTPSEKLEILQAAQALANELIPAPWLEFVTLIITALEAAIHTVASAKA